MAFLTILKRGIIYQLGKEGKKKLLPPIHPITEETLHSYSNEKNQLVTVGS